uniref:Putative histone 2B n=1 Tax=Amphidinium carterae TaxID=2961 RepID=E3UGH3_AMPCA|nr:putative histone 2B [Amphidinium carterae]ADK66835.1 putative histone 2B [Amphidinium carterae]|mmetsp:Transcript_42442/g.95436  ORF Transcript_42442/g.95436 Transcript_42442/m.95436 type:complete len:140 (+) Transcript_42442:78-497(+)
MALQAKKSKMPPAAEPEEEDNDAPAGKVKKDKLKVKDVKMAPYILKILKQVNKNATISKQAMCIMESCVNDTFDRLTAEAGSLMRHAGSKGKDTLGSREIQSATRFVFPAELARHAISEGCKAVMHYNTSKKGAAASKK